MACSRASESSIVPPSQNKAWIQPCPANDDLRTHQKASQRRREKITRCTRRPRNERYTAAQRRQRRGLICPPGICCLVLFRLTCPERDTDLRRPRPTLSRFDGRSETRPHGRVTDVLDQGFHVLLRHCRHLQAISEKPQQGDAEQPEQDLPCPDRRDTEQPRVSARPRLAENPVADHCEGADGEQEPGDRQDPGQRHLLAFDCRQPRMFAQECVKLHAMAALLPVLGYG